MKTTTESCATEENIYKTWEEFRQSKDVWNTLRRRPRVGDRIKYAKGQLFIKTV